MNEGWIKLITGPMFAGKTRTLMEDVGSYLGEPGNSRFRGRHAAVLFPETDTRSNGEFITHGGLRFTHPSMTIHVVNPKKFDVPAATLVVFDEAQFFEPENLLKTINHLVYGLKQRVLVAGLDRDFMGKPFGAIPDLLFMADEVEKLYGTCATCGKRASRTQRTHHSTEQVLVGGEGLYTQSCKFCHTIPV